mmetsp:Transcript_3506/g.4935  ORF Transcript_3506/g.4935 Transcript_3506/m.4935 type:complete len:323 (+) Transcript_3506:262-1230(+)
MDFFEQLLRKRFSSVRFGFAYGSGVFEQAGYNLNARKSPKDLPMIDLIVVVDNVKQWHKENLHRYPFDYWQPLAMLGADAITKVQTNFGAGLYYNTLVPLDCERKIKYGVISTEHFLEDLTDWRWLYTSGRLHKPVRIIQNKDANKDDSPLQTALKQNLRSALAASLLLLPTKFTEDLLYQTITGLSYSGDFRMTIGENPKKVQNIVLTNIEHFRNLYGPLLHDFIKTGMMSLNTSNLHGIERNYNKDTNASTQKALIQELPCRIHQKLNMIGESDIQNALRNILIQTTKSSSKGQAIKGFVTAGPKKSIQYGLAKLQKMFH